MKIGSLFSGIGGLELGLEWAGLGPVVWQVERDEFCRGVLARHWPEATRFSDVCEVGKHNLEPVDVICGGFPCQDLSFAGKGAGLAGERSGLWREYLRIVREVKPRFVVVENVAALRSRGLGTVLSDLASSGYDAEWFSLRAEDVGAPHRRERVFIVAHSNGCELANTERERSLLADPNGSAAGGAESPGHARADSIREQGHWNPERILGGKPNGVPARVDRWPAGRGQAQHSWEPQRTTKEQGNRSRRLKALGNAVVPQCAEVVGKIVLGLL